MRLIYLLLTQHGRKETKKDEITEYLLHRCKSNILKINVENISHKLDKIVKNHNAKGIDSDI